AWDHAAVGAPVRPTFHPSPPKEDVDDITVTGMEDVPYAIPSYRARARMVDVGVPMGIWRSVGSSCTTFAQETAIDELAALAGKDAVAFRLAHLGALPRLRAALERAAEVAGWPGRRDAGARSGSRSSAAPRTRTAQASTSPRSRRCRSRRRAR